HLLVDAGPASVPPIERFVNFSDAVYWPVKALKEIVGTDHAVGVLLAALDNADGLDQRVNERKTQIVSNLRDFPHPRVEERLVALCDDPDEDVRIMAVDGLLTYGPESALSSIARRLLDGEESPRVKTVILEQLIELDWSLAPWRAQLDEAGGLPIPYELTHDGRIQRG
ncbi:MAG: HEAT repeat domain-containing protein, partial [Myxococcota bacterium]|nr:HEAT repeat domain-containing protein [Myxococcota bacterium]